MTSKEVSARLKDLGFKGKTSDYFVDGNDYCYPVMFPETISPSDIPAYDAEVLFQWLREWKIMSDEYFIHVGMDTVVLRELGEHMNEADVISKYNGSLADMLGEAICWILENEK